MKGMVGGGNGTRFSCNFSTVFRSAGEGDITSLRQISTHSPPGLSEIYFAFKWFPPALCSLAE